MFVKKVNKLIKVISLWGQLVQFFYIFNLFDGIEEVSVSGFKVEFIPNENHKNKCHKNRIKIFFYEIPS